MDIRNGIASVACAGLALAAPGVAQSQSSPTTPYPQAPVVADSSMRLQVKPRDTVVFVDGYYAGVADDFDGTFQRLHIDAGQHRIQLFLPGHRLYGQDLYLQPGNTFTMRHTMEPLAPGEPEPERPTGSPQAPRLPPGPPSPPRDPATSRSPSTSSFGTLAVHVQPDEGLVIIDGERWNGSGDAIEVQLAPGAHTVEVRKAGFRGYLTEVMVRGGEVTRLNIALSPESAK